jgi:hypothetical protein
MELQVPGSGSSQDNEQWESLYPDCISKRKEKKNPKITIREKRRWGSSGSDRLRMDNEM